MTWSNNRLTVVGPKAQVQRFQDSNWERRLGAKHGEWLQSSPRRYACLFETNAPPLVPLRSLSRRWPGLVFLLDYEVEGDRLKGLAKAREGQLEHWETNY